MHLLLLACGTTACNLQPGLPRSDSSDAAPTPEYRPTPIPSGSTAALGRDDQRQRAAWGKRNFVQAYERAGLRSPRWDREARRFLEAGLASVLGLPGGPDRAVHIARGKALLAAGCRDPAVIYVLARALADVSPYSPETSSLLAEAIEGMKRAPYPRAAARYVVSGLCREYEVSLENRGRCRALAPLEQQWFRESLRDSYEPGEAAVLAYQLSNGTGPSLLERGKVEIPRAVQEATWTEPWLHRLVAGMSEIDLAFEARGTNFADKVTPEGWERFFAYMARAREDLQEARRLRPDRPEAAAQMILVLLSGHTLPGESERLWFDRTVAAQMDYLPAYRAMINYLRPRWHGSYDELLAFGRECLETGRFDTEVPRFLLTAVEQIEQDQKDENEGKGVATVFREPEVYPLLVRLFEGYLADASHQPVAAALRSDYALAADKAGHPADALRQLQANRFELDHAVVDKIDEPPDRFVGRIAVYGGPAGREVAASDQKLASGGLDDTRSLLREAAQKDPDPRTARFITHRLASLDLEAALAGGDWVGFLPRGPELPGWESMHGDWELLKDGGLRARPNTRGTWIYCNARVGSEFEMRGEVELGPGAEGGYQAGAIFGDLRPQGGPNWFSFRLFRDRWSADGSLLAREFSSAGRLAKFALRPDSNSFRILSRNGRFDAWVNDRQVVIEFPPPKEYALPRDALVGFGGYRDDNDFVVTYRRVELRRLASSPVP